MNERRASELVAVLAEPFSAFGRHASLTRELTKRDILGRYRGASFGLLWAILSPFLMLLIYAVAFGSIFKSRWPQQVEGGPSYALIMFAGLIVHGFFTECLSRAPGLIVGNANYVKRVVFPLEILPWPMVMSAFFHAGVSMFVLLGLQLIQVGPPPWTFVFFPLVLAPLALLCAAIGWLFASLAVYLRDISQITGVLSAAMLFLSSALVPVEVISTDYQFLFRMNPLTFIIDQMRDVTLWGVMPDWIGLGAYAAVSLMICFLCYGWFRATRSGFADVL
ncbi:ABC transporter permease [Tahibacter sp.]|uniref:ABC transporter permease n=1 Tax=Tahibacter sp. TaxID=2056211 RepID=UPI0028C508C4|nr:ABC transporter permease [Tahibacter sp.]